MDELDKKLLKDLSRDSRMTYAELGRKYDLSRVCIRERVNNLVEKGIIEKFTIVVNPQKMGKNLCVYFDIEVKPDKLYQTAEELAKEKSIVKVVLMTGSPTLYVNALLKDHKQLETFMKEKIYSHEEIIRVRTNIALKSFKSLNPGACS